MGRAKQQLMENYERRVCIECGVYVEERENGWYCPECKTLFIRACDECQNVFNPKNEDEDICHECWERNLERID